MFKLVSEYTPTGDQPSAIKMLAEGLNNKKPYQVLLGVTGSGKTFSVANVIAKVNKPTLIVSHNKTLAAQLYQEFKSFFPENAVEYFVSYYDYYQPESYIPQTDTYIEKDADINEEIDKLRLSATNSLITREDVIIVASVSCIYNLGSPAEYSKVAIELKTGMKFRQVDLFKRLNQLYYERSDFEFKRGTFRVRGDSIDVFPSYQEIGIRIAIPNDRITGISYFDPISGDSVKKDRLSDVTRGIKEAFRVHGQEQYMESGSVLDFALIFPSKHYVSPEDKRESALLQIEADLKIRVDELNNLGKKLEAYRLSQKTNYDLEMIREIGYCKGIENYSRYFDGRAVGDSPYTLLDFFPKDFLCVIDESHITVPQIRGMYNGDRSRKETLIDYGFRLPSALDNRPLKFEEFMRKVPAIIFTSATPNDWEKSLSAGNIAEQLIRPTGLVDPIVTILPTKGQISDLIVRINAKIAKKQRVLVTTITKRMAEELATYLKERNIKVTYLHSDIETLERTNILDLLRRGEYDVLVGINLLREGLDLPEVALVAILDADKEGFLRSESSLIQTMGRAARHIDGEVVMYADRLTSSMERALFEVDRRRKVQTQYNKEHGITPLSIIKPLRERMSEQEPNEEEIKKEDLSLLEDVDFSFLPPSKVKKEIKRLEMDMKYEAEVLNFEKAAKIRDRVLDLKKFL